MFQKGDTPWNKGARTDSELCPSGHDYSEFAAFTAEGYRYCKECKRIRTTNWRDDVKQDPIKNEDRKEKMRESAKQRNRRYRSEAIEAYGSACVCCGETIPEFLHLDHVNNDGAEHRRELGNGSERGSMALLTWARNNDWPDTLQLKCHNCGMAEGFYGYCPHETN